MEHQVCHFLELHKIVLFFRYSTGVFWNSSFGTIGTQFETTQIIAKFVQKFTHHTVTESWPLHKKNAQRIISQQQHSIPFQRVKYYVQHDQCSAERLYIVFMRRCCHLYGCELYSRQHQQQQLPIKSRDYKIKVQWIFTQVLTLSAREY